MGVGEPLGQPSLSQPPGQATVLITDVHGDGNQGSESDSEDSMAMAERLRVLAMLEAQEKADQEEMVSNAIATTLVPGTYGPGLSNPTSSTCYLNAWLQSVCHATPGLCNALEEHGHTCLGGHCMLCQLPRVLRALNTADPNSVVDSTGITDCIPGLSPPETAQWPGACVSA